MSGLRCVALDWPWPAEVTPRQLHGWLKQQLELEGEPLRWAITAVQAMPDGMRRLQLEAVLLEAVVQS